VTSDLEMGLTFKKRIQKKKEWIGEQRPVRKKKRNVSQKDSYSRNQEN